MPSDPAFSTFSSPFCVHVTVAVFVPVPVESVTVAVSCTVLVNNVLTFCDAIRHSFDPFDAVDTADAPELDVAVVHVPFDPVILADTDSAAPSDCHVPPTVQ